jgi:hypothetical protein
MLKTRSVSLLLLILGAGIVLGVFLHNNFSMKTVEAQSDKSQWEYCRVQGHLSGADRFGRSFNYATIEYYQQADIKREEIKLERSSALSQAIARLGEEGWEMFELEAIENSYPYYYFKRIKR